MKATVAGVLPELLFWCSLPLYCQSGPPLGAPRSMRLCADGCSNLRWLNDHYAGVKDGQEFVSMTYDVIRWDADGIELRGKSANSVPGEVAVTAVFTGRIMPGGRQIVAANVVWQIGAERKSSSYQLIWDSDDSAPPSSVLGERPSEHASRPETVNSTPTTIGPGNLPSVMHFCGLNCGTLIWDGNNYTQQKNPDDHSNFTSTWTVIEFTRQSVILSRHDSWRPAHPEGWTDLFKGQISKDGNHIINLTNYDKASPTFLIGWGSALSLIPGSNEEQQTLRTQICASPRIRGAMQRVEDQAIHDLNGAVLAQFFGDAGSARILDSKDGTDGGRYTSQDPGSFVCRGLFLHQDLKIDTTDKADPAEQISAEAMKAIMSKYPTFVEWFKVKRTGFGAYRLTLLPSSLPLAKEYTGEFAYP